MLTILTNAAEINTDICNGKNKIMISSVYTFLITSLLSVAHPFFVSMTDINYNKTDKTLEVSVRIFTDDLENTIRKYHQGDIDILHPADQKAMNGYVDAYIRKHLGLKADGKTTAMSFVGYEQESESIWSYFEIKNIPEPKRLDVYNSLLQDYNNNQINMMHVKVNGEEKNTKLDYPDKQASFTF